MSTNKTKAELVAKIDMVTLSRSDLEVSHAQLEKALRHISLCSQNSASSKEECGNIARRALGGEP
jgi:hypothetical protein